MKDAFPCSLVGSETGRDSDPAYKDPYTFLMQQSIFALCPSGNSPETFRHYEALEYGAIPIIIRTEPQYNFISEIWTAEYPGPLFDDWGEAVEFLLASDEISKESLDALQKTLIDWYATFKTKTRRQLQGLITEAFQDATLIDDSKMAGYFATKGLSAYDTSAPIAAADAVFEDAGFTGFNTESSFAVM